MKCIDINNIYDIIFPYIIDELVKENKIKNDTKIIYPGLGYDLVYAYKCFKSKNMDYLLISFNDVDSNILNEISDAGINLITIPNYGIESLIDMADDVKLEIKDSFVLNLFKEKKGVSAIYKNYAKEFFIDNPNIKEIELPLVFGVLTGLAKYLKNKDEDIIVHGVKLNDYESDIIDSDYFDDIRNDSNFGLEIKLN